jgi:hypothetical protein
MNATKTLGLFLLLLAGIVSAADQSTNKRIEPFEVLSFHASESSLEQATSPQQWLMRRKEILLNMQDVTGPLPGAEKRSPLDVHIEEETDCGSYVRRLITYSSEPGSRTPAYLCIPKTALTPPPHAILAPGVLCLHPTDNTLGNKVVVGLGGKANRQYASELAQRGFVTISPSYPLLAQYQPDLKALGYQSGTMKAIWDNIRALDVLDALPYVKHGSYGTIGHSLGGHNSIFTAIFDSRIHVIVSSCGFDSFFDYRGGNPKLWVHGQGWCQDRYMPKLAEYKDRLNEIPFNFDELIAALAPRDLFINAPLHDDNFQWQSVDRIVAAAKRVYALHKAEAKLQVEHPDCPHDFPDAMREKAYGLLEKVLK